MNLAKVENTVSNVGRRVGRTLNGYRVAIGVVFLLHLGALFTFFPASELLQTEPLWTDDYPVHTHRVHVYREALWESGLPWGYDPDVSAGAVMDPVHDVGAKPMQVFGVMVPFLSSGQVVRLFLVLSVLSLPLWILLACKWLDVPREYHAWILLVVVAPVWFVRRLFIPINVGLLSFTVASYFSIFVLAVFLSYLRRPRRRTYVILSLAAAFLFFLHLVGPVVIVPAMAILVLSPGVITWSHRVALVLVPGTVAVLNSFWFVPFLWARYGMSHYPEERPPNPPDMMPHMTVTDWSELVARIAVPHKLGLLLVGSCLAAYGLFVLLKPLGRRNVAVIGFTSLFGLALTYLGSFIPILVQMQPIRFLSPTVALMAIPVGAALAVLCARVRVSPNVAVVGLSVVVAAGAVVLDRPWRLPLPPSSDPLVEFIRNKTNPQDRLLIQSPDGYQWGDYETKVFPLLVNRETLGSNFPLISDPPQFLRTMLLGREIQEWEPSQLRPALERWGISWAFTRTVEADSLLVHALGPPDAEVGKYLAFRLAEDPDRFMVGTGLVGAEVNRLHLSGLVPEEGLVVLRYRFHPAWTSDGETDIQRIRVPEDPAGFIGLRNPPPELTLRFDPIAMLSARWPDAQQLPSRVTRHFGAVSSTLAGEPSSIK